MTVSARYWLRVDADKCLVVCEDAQGELVTAEEFRTEGLGQNALLWQVADSVQAVVARAPSYEFIESARDHGLSLRGKEPFPGFSAAIEARAGYRIVPDSGGVSP